MNQVRPRSRKAAMKRVREVQGMFAMQGFEEAWGGETEFATDRGVGTTKNNLLTKPERATASKSLPYRSVLAEWPDPWRERWGRRANDLEDSGLSWRDAEGRAFIEVWEERRIASDVARN